ncbi:MAG: helix-turn-helix transcriptional regulator [Solirubrobacteraceae bacterium]
MLERERELDDLETLAGAISAGRGFTVVIEGQPGLGKSRLLEVACARSGSAGGLVVLRFACGELESELPWAGVVGLFGEAVARLDDAGRRALFAGAASPAAALFEDPVLAAGREAHADAFSIIHALYLLVGGLAGQTPLLLVLDDAHWCDPRSLQFLLYLQRRLSRLRAGLVLAARPQMGSEQRDLLHRIAAGPDVRTHRLGPLGFESVRALVRAGPYPAAGDAFCGHCRRVTAGNPFYLRELLIGLRADKVDEQASLERLLEAPSSSISRSVLVRLARLPVRGGAELACAVAVLGDGAALRHAASLARVGDRGGEIADALAAAELLTAGEPLRFVHPLVRRAIYADMPAARRARLHAAAADLLACERAAPELVAAHLLHVPLGASLATVAGLRAAAVSARRHGAPEAAVRYLRRALLEPPVETDRVDVLVELAEVEAMLSDPEAVEHLKVALEHAPAQRQAQIMLALGWAEHHAGRFSAAADAFERALGALDEHPSELAAELEAGYLASATLDASRAVDAAARIEVIEQASAESQDPAHRALLAQVLFGWTMSGRPHEDVVELAQRLWTGGQLLEEEGAESRTIWHVVGALSWADAYPQAYSALAAIFAAAEIQGSALAHAQGRYARAWPNYWTGRLADAAADARAAIEIWYGGLETYLPAAIYWLILAELERDQLAAAEHALTLAAPFERWHGTGMAGFVVASEGHLAAHRGDAAGALERHLRCGELMGELQIANPAVMPWRNQAALAAALIGERERGRELIAEELTLARAIGTPRAIGTALRVAGLLAQEPESTRLLGESVDVLTTSVATLEYARASVDLGAALRRAGKRGAARPSLGRGLELAHAAGATRLAARARTELRAAGDRSHRPAQSGSTALTASEHRVAEMAAAGHPNRYIAATLQVSVKAVEWHLSQCYRKLDINSRRRLAHALRTSDT